MLILKKKYLILLQVFFCILILPNCSNNSKTIILKEAKDSQIYIKGQSFLKSNDYKKAAIEFDKIYLNYPFSSLAPRAEIMTAYSLFQDNQINEAIGKLDEFIEMNPTGEHTQYAQYLLAMSFYVQIADPGRDPRLSEKALKYFKIITTKFPKTVYAKDAKFKINFIKNSLAQNELLIGMFYLKHNSPASSIKRFQAIIKNYQTTSVIPETLYRLCEAFLMLGLKEEAIKSSLVLNYNFPDNEWTNLSKNIIKDTPELDVNKGFINSITDYIKKITN
ncbi:outer membrane protein assembly factor BamD [Alphaproteobacteria bacterium]|nr:outer membrane protein assembly factor BamD [Alphaproteobacteria bacterium]